MKYRVKEDDEGDRAKERRGRGVEVQRQGWGVIRSGSIVWGCTTHFAICPFVNWSSSVFPVGCIVLTTFFSFSPSPLSLVASRFGPCSSFFAFGSQPRVV